MPKTVKSFFDPPDKERVTCPYCGQVISALWVTNEDLKVTSEVCPHYVGHDRTHFFFDAPRQASWDWDVEKTFHQ